MQNIGEINNQISKIALKKETIEENIETFVNNMWEQYEITYANACNDYETIEISYEKVKRKRR